MNYNIPSFKALVRRSHLTKREEDMNIYDDCYVFGVQSVGGKVLTFHIMTDYGMLRSRTPISEVFSKVPHETYPVDFLQLWDCFSETAHVTVFDYLKDKRCEVILKDRSRVWATYKMTVDWSDNPYSEEPTDYKCGHLLLCDNGQYMLQPNNRIFWKDMNFIVGPSPINPKDYKVDRKLESVESVSDRWVSENSENYYYEIDNRNSFENRGQNKNKKYIRCLS